mmetsp:Transcript_48394/g.65875  ORF Transcript_48394/g.65875 Transcript_48394/m.65875 type:complete len:563 (-) Transcript_48394:935-2623(-)
MEEVEDGKPQLTSRTFPDWKRGKILGRGAHGTVYLGRIEKNGQYIAVKSVHTEGMNNADLDAIEHEIRMIRSLQHTNIVRYLGTEKRRHTLNIFLEYAAGGCLRQLLQEHGRLSEETTALFSHQILRGLDYLHSNGIAHRDIKGANVLLAAEGHCKLADFGASKRVEANSLVSGLKGTPHWMAPEVIKGQQTSHGWIKADVWSIGCTVIEMLTGKMPWPMFPNPMAAMYHIANGERPPIDGVSISDEADAFISACCQQDPINRSTTSVLLKAPFLNLRNGGSGGGGDGQTLSSVWPPSSSQGSKSPARSPIRPGKPHKRNTSEHEKKKKKDESDSDDSKTNLKGKAKPVLFSPIITHEDGKHLDSSMVFPLAGASQQERPKERSQLRRSIGQQPDTRDHSERKISKTKTSSQTKNKTRKASPSRPRAAASSEFIGLKERYGAIDHTTFNSAAIRREAALQLSCDVKHMDRLRHSKSAGVPGALSPLSVMKRLPPLINGISKSKSSQHGPVVPMLPLRSIASAPSNDYRHDASISASLPQLPGIRGGKSAPSGGHPLRRSNPM